ncbi:alpha/beta hydrolase [Nocardioides dilutus]
MTHTHTHTHTHAHPATPTGLAAGIGATLDVVARIAPRLAGSAALELWRRPGRPALVGPDERAVLGAARIGVAGRAGHPVVTYRWGDGARPVLLVHGWASRASRFADFVTALVADGWSPMAYDAWAHGATRGPARTIPEHHVVITELAERHGPFEGVVAHSFGVPVSLYAARHGLAADRLVAISGVGDFGSLVDTFCRRIGAGAAVNRELRRAIERRWFDGDTGIWDRFSAHPAPGRDILVVHDTGDRVVDRGQADLVTAAYGPRATLLETSGLGHGRILRDPGVIAASVGFLGGRAS